MNHFGHHSLPVIFHQLAQALTKSIISPPWAGWMWSEVTVPDIDGNPPTWINSRVPELQRDQPQIDWREILAPPDISDASVAERVV